MIGGNKIDVVRAHVLQRAEDPGQALNGDRCAAAPARKFPILAEYAAERAAAEKDGAAAVFVRDGRLFIRMQIVFCNGERARAASSRALCKVGAAPNGAEFTFHIQDYIVNDLKRSATVCHAQGAFSGKDKYIVFTALNRPQAVRLRNFIKDAEPDAFILISNTSEIIGKGFHNV